MQTNTARLASDSISQYQPQRPRSEVASVSGGAAVSSRDNNSAKIRPLKNPLINSKFRWTPLGCQGLIFNDLLPPGDLFADFVPLFGNVLPPIAGHLPLASTGDLLASFRWPFAEARTRPPLPLYKISNICSLTTPGIHFKISLCGFGFLF